MSMYPKTIDNGHGEHLTFIRRCRENDTDKLEVENLVLPGSGPPMHVHFLQVENLTVIESKLAAQIFGKPAEYFGPGDTISFNRGIPHRFWNAGNTPLRCKGYIWPANNIEYFLSAIYASAKQSPKGRPQLFDGAYLLQRYKSEFDMPDIPPFVKKVIFPVALAIGKLLGKDKKFADAPPPVLG